MAMARMALRVGGRFHGRRSRWLGSESVTGAGRAAASGWQTLIWAGAVSVGMRGPPCGKPSRALVLRSRCRFRSMLTRRRARPARTRPSSRRSGRAGRLAVAVPARVVAMMARRAAVNEIWRGWTGGPARLPLRAGTAMAAAARAVARASSTEMTQAACSWAIRAGDCGAEHRPGGRPGVADRGLGFFQGGLGPDPPPVIGGGQGARRVGVVVVQVGDQAEQLGGVVPGDATVYSMTRTVSVIAAAGDGQVGAVGQEVPVRSRVMPSLTRISTWVPVASIRPMRGTPGKFLSMVQSRARGEQPRVVLQRLVQQRLLGLALVPAAAGAGAGRAGGHGQGGAGGGGEQPQVPLLRVRGGVIGGAGRPERLPVRRGVREPGQRPSIEQRCRIPTVEVDELAIAGLAICTGRALLGVTPAERTNVWVWNGEDPLDELQRRVTAAALFFDVERAELQGRLFVNSVRNMPVEIVADTRDGVTVNRIAVKSITNSITRNAIGVMIVDPFVASHRTRENDNTGMELVARTWAEIAERTGAAIELVHHPRKSQGGQEIGVEDGRGGSAIYAKARSVRV